MIGIIRDQENTIEDIRREIELVIQHDNRILAKDYNDFVQKQEELKKTK